MSITAGGQFSWTPTESQGGSTYDATITVTDSGTGNLIDSETISITVGEVNVAPILDPIGNKLVDEQAELAFTATATDQDLPADTLTFTLDAAAIALGMSITTGGQFSWTPTESQGGNSYDATITVTDSGTGTLTDSETITITVGEVNVAPILDPIGNKLVDEQAELTFTATATDQDLPADSLTFTLDAAAIALGMSITTGGQFSWTPTESQGGSDYSATITVTDSGTGNLTGSEGRDHLCQRRAPTSTPVPTPRSTKAVRSPPAARSLIRIPAPWTATVDYGDGTGPETLTLNPDKIFGLSHTYTDDGSYTVTVTVTDSEGGQSSDTILVSVINVAPTLTISGDASVDADAIYTLGLSASDPGDDTIASWQINWGDDQIGILTGDPTSATHVYVTARQLHDHGHCNG